MGYLHLGFRGHGIRRYGEILAAEARRRGHGVHEVALSESELVEPFAVRAAAERLSDSDVVHVQYNAAIWGGARTQEDALTTFFDSCGAPVVASAHDIYLPTGAKFNGPRLMARMFVRAVFPAVLRVHSKSAKLDTLAGFRILQSRAVLMLVCFEEERARLAALKLAANAEVIPHFVEPRCLDRPHAKQIVGLDGRRVVTLLGFVHERKGHRLLAEALPQLPEDVVVAFVGAAAPGSEEFLSRILRDADAAGVRERIRVTGYVEEDLLDAYLAATDVAVCPFRRLSASSSLATWISAECRILAFALPQVAEYNSIVPEAIDTFSPYTVEALAERIEDLLNEGTSRSSSVARLTDALSLEKTFNAHENVYRRAIGEFTAVS